MRSLLRPSAPRSAPASSDDRVTVPDDTRGLLALSNWVAGLLCAVLFFGILLPRVLAAAPTGGTLSPNGLAVAFSGTATGTGAANGEGACIEGVNCDTYTLTVTGQPADWTGKFIPVEIAWTLPADDYDLYIHQGDVNGPIVASSATGAPGTSENAGISPATTGTGVYTIHVLYFTTAAGDQYRGTASVAATSARFAHYSAGNFRFTADVPLKGPATTADSEPSSRTDVLGNNYISGIRGFPAGVDLWYFDLNPSSLTFDPNLRNPLYRGQPDGFTGGLSAAAGISAGGDGGGDIDLAVGFPTDGTVPTLAFSSLIAANLSVGKSTDTGKTFQLNSAGNLTGGVPGDDRQWLEAFGKNTVYLLYRTLDPAVTQIQRSDDGGLTYGPAATAGTIGQTGAIDVDPTDGTVFVSGSNGVVAVGTPLVAGLAPLTSDYHTYPAATDPNGVAHLFFQVAVARDSGVGPGKNGKPYGTVYVCYSNDYDIFIEHSLDRGKTWSAPVKVSSPDLSLAANVFPRLALGPQYGEVGVAWYGTTDKGRTSSSVGSDTAQWRVYYALTTNATAPGPTFLESVASSHVIHAGNISEGGLTTTGVAPNRNLGDYFEFSYDTFGAAMISYDDDHNDYRGICYATRQIGGTSISGTALTPLNEGSSLAVAPPPAGPPVVPAGSQVADFAQDPASALVATTPANSAADILDVRYGAPTIATGQTISATMTVSDLARIPPSSTWRMSLTANAPLVSTTPAGSPFSFGLSDLGDQFYLQAASDAQSNVTYTYGKATRAFDGSLVYTKLGPAASGGFDLANRQITVKALLSDLNKAVTHGPPLGSGSVLCGLRASTTNDGSGVALSDTTYGGTQYTIPAVDIILSALTFPSPVPGGTIVTATVTLSGPATADTVVGLSSSDSSIVRVHRAVIVPAGSTSATFLINTFRSHVTKTVTIQATLGCVALTKDLTISGR